VTQSAYDKMLNAEIKAGMYLGNYNERIERIGREDAIAARLYAKAQFWLDRYNKLAGNA